MDANAIAITIGGLVIPLIQEVLVGRKIDGRPAVVINLVAAFAVALFATWVTGGLAGGKVPAFSLVDPSPLLAFLAAKLAPTFAISQLVYALLEKQIKKVALAVPAA